MSAVRSWTRAQRYWAGAAGAAVVVAAVIAAVVAGSGAHHARELPPTRARAYTQQQACLLTGSRGLADPAAAPVWAGMQDASTRTHAKVMYLAMAGDQSAAAAGPYLASLAERHCTVVLAAGAGPAGAVDSTGVKFPGTRFVAVTAPASADAAAASPAPAGTAAAPRAAAANVTAVADSRAAVAAAVEAAVRD